MDDESVVSKMSGIVPEMWHDLIARITPGMVILYTVTASESQSLKEVSLGGFAGLLVLAYLVGLVTDLATGWAAAFVTRITFLHPLSLENYNAVDDLPSPSRELMVKMFAEVVLCRSLFFYALVHLLAAGWIGIGLSTPHLFQQAFGSIPASSFAISLLATALMCICWWRMSKEAQKRFTELKDRHAKALTTDCTEVADGAVSDGTSSPATR